MILFETHLLENTAKSNNLEEAMKTNENHEMKFLKTTLDLVVCPCWKATKEYLNQRGTKIRVFRVRFQALSPETSSLIFTLSFPFRPCSLCHHFSPLHLPLYPPFLTPGKLRFRYPSDFGTL